MKGQEISPWTFLNDRIDLERTDNYYNLPSHNNQDYRLPKITKTPLKDRKQQSQILAFKRKGLYNKGHTLILSQQQNSTIKREKDIATSLSIKFNKPREHIQIKDDSILIEQYDEVAYLCQMKLLAKLIYSSLSAESIPTINQQLIVNRIEDPLLMMRDKISGINMASQQSVTVSNRIHNRDAQLKISGIRQMIKREREGLNWLKKRVGSKNEEIMSLKNKLTSLH